MSKYYDYPTQIMFYADDEEEKIAENLLAGIAYEDEVICSCCGCVFNIEDIDIIADMDWVNFYDEIADTSIILQETEKYEKEDN